MDTHQEYFSIQAMTQNYEERRTTCNKSQGTAPTYIQAEHVG